MNANKRDAGGLPELPEPVGHVHSDYEYCAERPFKNDGWPVSVYEAHQVRAYGELCRAAPAGGDYPNEADGLALELVSVTEERDFLRRRVAELSAPAGGVCDKLRPGAPCQSPDSCRENGCAAVERELYSAPAGSGEVDRMIHEIENEARRLRMIERVESTAAWLERIAALLRKLQQGADGWIAASERLPERIEGTAHSADVLVSDGKRVWIHCAYFDWKACERDYWGDTPYVPRLGSGATHWRPLPAASQGREGG